jgi:threonine/homoserine/homoserine lactone efflux protein
VAAGTDPGRWSRSVLAWALRVLVAAVALRLALNLLVSMAPVLIGGAIIAGVIYLLYMVYKIRRSRW